MSQPKVFEFAKELGMQTLELMDKLREWKIPVKSHMAELDSDTLEVIRTKLSSGGDSAKKTVKKKKPVEAKAEAAPAKVAAKSVAKPVKAGAKPAAKAGKVAPTTATAKKKAAAAAEAAPSEPAGKKVIRRKAGSAEAAAAESKAAEAEEAEQSSEERLEQSLREQAQKFTQNKQHETHESHPVAEIAARAVTIEAQKVVATPVPEEQIATTAVEASNEVFEPAVDAKHVAPPALEVPHSEYEVAPAAVKATSVAAPATAIIGGPTEVRAGEARPQIDTRPRPAIKREVVVGNSQIQSDAPRVARPRGNIVGRMDLSRATPPPGSLSGGSRPGSPMSGPGASRPGGPSSGPGGAPGFRGTAPRPGGNIRPGFFQAPPTEVPALGRPEDRRRPMRPRVAGAPGTGPVEEGAAREEVVESFLSSEYRKREVVFQPKKKVNILTREAKKTQITTAKASKRMIEINKTIIVKDLAEQMKMKAGPLVSNLMKNGMVVTMNSELDFDTATLLATEFGFETENIYRSADEMLQESKVSGTPEGSVAITRSPIVTVMGHVDHGKTSLLDAIRKTDIAAGEAGGITQHIGAYRVTLEDGQSVTFIDTPGHAAFTAMRARGANVTDIAVIVVAGDDGAMPQTVEAINHAKSAGVPIIVAINKMDKPGVNPERIKQQLTEYELVPEEWGGSTIFVPVSATKRTGIKELLEQIHLLAEIQELKATLDRPASGTVIEARVEKGRGVVATVLVQDGVLRVGQPIVAGKCFGKIRAMLDDKRKPMKEAGPSIPVEILGLNETPNAGDRFDACADETSARQIAEARRELVKSADKTPASKMTLEDLFTKVKMGDTKELILILKADVSGSAEAVKSQLEKLGTAEVKTKVIHTAIGQINESDVLLASTTKGIIIGFNVKADSQTTALAQQEGVDIKMYNIIYELLDDVKKAMGGLLTPEIVEKTLGRVEVRNVFALPKAGTIAGGLVTEGKVVRSANVRLVREGKVVFEGKISSLRRFKDDVREVLQGFECGVGIDSFNDIKVGDFIEAFEKQTIQRTIQ